MAEYSLPISLLRSRQQYLDLNPKFGGPGESDVLYEKEAVRQGLLNIFQTAIGEAGPIFSPEFGAPIYELLQEPFDGVTAARLESVVFQAVQRWEPRVEILFSESSIETDYVQPGYKVTLTYRLRQSGETSSLRTKFNVR